MTPGKDALVKSMVSTIMRQMNIIEKDLKSCEKAPISIITGRENEKLKCDQNSQYRQL